MGGKIWGKVMKVELEMVVLVEEVCKSDFKLHCLLEIAVVMFQVCT